jgi:hypothetical protein
MELILNLKKSMWLPRVSLRFKKKSVLKLLDHTVYMPIELILNKKKVCVFLMCLRIKKKISPKTFEPNCVFLSACMWNTVHCSKYLGKLNASYTQEAHKCQLSLHVNCLFLLPRFNQT